jgi:hypothetical protein
MRVLWRARSQARLQRLVELVNRTLASLDLNPLLASVGNTVNTLGNDVGNAVNTLVGSLGNVLAQFSNNAGTILQALDPFGNIVQRVINPVTNAVLSQQIVGNYAYNMTRVGPPVQIGSDTQQKYVYNPFGTIVTILFDAAGNVLSATVQNS